jgi:hypothetical protein
VRIEPGQFNDILVIPEQKYKTVSNKVSVQGRKLEVINSQKGSFSVKIPSGFCFHSRQVKCGGREGVSRVSIEGFVAYIQTPSWSGSRPPWCETLVDIPFGKYQVETSKDGLTAVLTKV